MATVAPQVGHLLVQGDGHAVKAGVQQRLERPQLGGEAVAGMDARHAAKVRTAEGGTKSSMLTDQGDGTRPRRQGVDALGEGHADHRANGVAGPTRPTSGFQLGHKLVDLRACRAVPRSVPRPSAVVQSVRPWRSLLLVQTPEGANLAGSPLISPLNSRLRV
jgi:hypothetical protein